MQSQFVSCFWFYFLRSKVAKRCLVGSQKKIIISQRLKSQTIQLPTYSIHQKYLSKWAMVFFLLLRYCKRFSLPVDKLKARISSSGSNRRRRKKNTKISPNIKVYFILPCVLRYSLQELNKLLQSRIKKIQERKSGPTRSHNPVERGKKTRWYWKETKSFSMHKMQ